MDRSVQPSQAAISPRQAQNQQRVPVKVISLSPRMMWNNTDSICAPDAVRVLNLEQLYRPVAPSSDLPAWLLIMLYQPNSKFNNVFRLLDREKKNRFVIVGTKTDLNFLNRINKNYQQEITHQIENYQAELNLNY